VLDVFRAKRDIYVREAAGIFHCNEDLITPDRRQIGKVAILSCFTAKTKVLTDNGVKDIVDVLLTDKLWDGISWVNHQGLVSRGKKEVINVCGMFVTADHLLKVKHDWLDAKTVLMSKSTLTLALATGSANLPFLGMKSLRQGFAILDWLSFNAFVVRSRIKYSFITYLKARLRGVMFALKNNRVFGVKTISNMLRLAPMTSIADAYLIGFQRVKIDATTLMIEPTRIMAGGESFCLNLGGLIKQRFYATWLILKAGIYRVWNWTGLTLIKGMSLTILDLLLEKKTSITEGLCKKCNKKSLSLKPVYDILNSGVNHRFTVLTDKGALLVHNCGFGGGIGAFAAMGRAYGILMEESDARRTVNAWRRANPWAVNFWQKIEEAYTRAMRNKGHEFTAGRITYLYDGRHLWYALPSGRILCYPFAKLDSDGVSYLKAAWKPAADAKEWPRARLWKGLACENVTQACANDLLRHALRQLDGVVLHVHDEIVVECAARQADAMVERVRRAMCDAPVWAEGIPLDVEINVMTRYGK
jgi:DNA polymerase